MGWHLHGECSYGASAGFMQPDAKGREMLFLGCKLQGHGSPHRTLSQTRPLQQHTGLSRTARRYPATGANGQLISNALPSGPRLELRDSSPQATHVNHLSPLWGKAAIPLDLEEQSISIRPILAPPLRTPSLSGHSAVTLSFTFSANQMNSICAFALCRVPGSQTGRSSY